MSEEHKQEEDRTPGLFSWRELVSQDVEGSTKFYTEMFGWTVESMDMGGGNMYSMFMNGKTPVAGLIKPPKEGAPTAWINYVTVEDVDAAAAKAQELGAHVCIPPTDIPGKGRFSGVADPQGGMIAFWQFAEGDCS